MTVSQVRKEISTALATANRVSAAEARRIVSSAQDGKVTAAESKLIVDLFDRASGPGGAKAPSMTAGAKSVFDEFFLKVGLPAGSGLAVVQQRIEATLATVRFRAPLPKAPSTASSIRVPLDGGREAWLNLSKGTFVLNDSSSGKACWYGPVALQAAPPAQAYTQVARRVLDELGLGQMTVNISQSEAERQSKLGGTIGFEQALRASLQSFLANGEGSGSFLNILNETGPVDGAPADPNEAVRFFLNRPSTTIALVPMVVTDKDKSQGIFPPENGEPVKENWVFTVRAPDLSETLHWAVTDRSGATPTFNYGFD
ncbi:MAG: hypothetical protein QM765_24275 [Myxococcales bacterium]